MLLLDIGNSRIKYTVATNQHFTSYEAITHKQLTELWMDQHWGTNKIIYISSVAHEALVEVITHWADLKAIKSVVIKSENSYAGLTNAYLEPESLGVDRWLAMLGAKVLFPSQNLLIIDAGTATTVDLIRKDGAHQGGWIFPGLNMLVNSVVNNTAHVKGSTINPALAFGRNTCECLNFSAIAGTIALIEKSIEITKNSTGLDQVLLLGGNSDVIAQYLRDKISIRSDLIFHGLHEYSKDTR